MDAVDPAFVDTADAALNVVSGVRDVEVLRLRWIGHRLHAETALVVDPALSVVDAHAIATSAQHELLHQVPRLDSATVHISPAGPAGDEHHAQLEHHRQEVARRNRALRLRVQGPTSRTGAAVTQCRRPATAMSEPAGPAARQSPAVGK